MTEEWRPYYNIFVSNHGNVLRYNRRGELYRFAADDNHYYVRVTVNKASMYVHRLVYTLFKGEIPSDMQIDHIDNNKKNNHIDNLRLLTIQENNRRRIIKPKYNKYTPETVMLVKQWRANGVKIHEIARKLNCNMCVVHILSKRLLA